MYRTIMLFLNAGCVSSADWALPKCTKTLTHSSMLEPAGGAANRLQLCAKVNFGFNTKHLALKQKGQWLVWRHDSSLYKCFGKRFCRKVSLEVSIAKNMRLRDGIDTSTSAVISLCSSKHPCRHCLQFIAPSSRSKLTPFMLFSPQTYGWNVTSLTTWNLLRMWYDDPAPKVQNSASETVRANFSEMLNPAILKQGD